MSFKIIVSKQSIDNILLNNIIFYSLNKLRKCGVDVLTLSLQAWSHLVKKNTSIQSARLTKQC